MSLSTFGQGTKAARIAKLLNFDEEQDSREDGLDIVCNEKELNNNSLNSSVGSGHVGDVGISEELNFRNSDDIMDEDDHASPSSLVPQTESNISSSEDLHFCHSSTREIVNSKGDTPPYKRVRALRLFESPQSPKTLLQIAQCQNTAEAKLKNGSRGRLFGSDATKSSSINLPEKRNADSTKNADCEANVNPFTPSSMMMQSRLKKRKKTCVLNGSQLGKSIEEIMEDDFGDDEDEIQPLKRIDLKGANISRYNTEFVQVDQIGSGDFGTVYKCINRLDGCAYALKRSRKPLRGTVNERRALNEVHAHAVLGIHPHVVRYYSAWAENGHMLIQNEYCNGGSLADVIKSNAISGIYLSEAELKLVLLHVAEGLKYIHSLHLVHMDIKPDNIFISNEQKTMMVGANNDVYPRDSDDGFEDGNEEEVTYKIGDLGHVTCTLNPQVEEGDCRYMPLEILHENYDHLPKADIFALGLIIIELGGGNPLPKNGDKWHDVRQGKLPLLDRYSSELNLLLRQLINKDAEQRPTAAAITENPVLVPFANKTKAQLRKELNAEKFKNELLSKKLQEAAKCLQSGPIRSSRMSRLVGKKANRSHSVTNF